MGSTVGLGLGVEEAVRVGDGTAEAVVLGVTWEACWEGRLDAETTGAQPYSTRPASKRRDGILNPPIPRAQPAQSAVLFPAQLPVPPVR